MKDIEISSSKRKMTLIYKENSPVEASFFMEDL